MKHLPFLLSTLPIFWPSPANGITCYRPNGRSSGNNDAKKCNGVDGAVSMCCAPSDDCLKNGLCKVAGDESANISATYWRDTCSSSSWPDVGCLKMCASGDLESENTPMTPCDGTDYSEKWCCGTNTDCCGTKDEVSVPGDIYKSTASISAFSGSLYTLTTPLSGVTFTYTVPDSSLTAATTSATTSTTPTPSSEPESSSGLSTGGKAGVGVGVAAGAIAIIGLLAFFVYRKRKTKASGGSVLPAELPGSREAQELDAAPVYEKPAGPEDSRFELPGDSASTPMWR